MADFDQQSWILPFPLARFGDIGSCGQNTVICQAYTLLIGSHTDSTLFILIQEVSPDNYLLEPADSLLSLSYLNIRLYPRAVATAFYALLKTIGVSILLSAGFNKQLFLP